MIKKILLIFGTRPEAIKMAPVFYALKDDFEVKICVTGQHDQMLHQVLDIFEIKPDFDLKIMQPNQTLSSLTSRLIDRLDNLYKELVPDLVLVHGDTSTCFCACLGAFYNNISVGHIEAGLRTYDIHSPFPEEFNRQMASKISKFHFAPTTLNKKNLMKENISEKNIYVTGNTVIDALKFIANKINSDDNKRLELTRSLEEKLGYKFLESKSILITGHRRENFGVGFEGICKGIKMLADEFNNIDFIYPVHLNPNVLSPVNNLLGKTNNIHICPPLEYEQFVFLMKESFLILTDSGGIQEEAPALDIPVLVMREKTERVEALEAGTVLLVGTDPNKIYAKTKDLIDNKKKYLKISKATNPYGNGNASEKISSIIKKIRNNL